ncbi:MAG TPA: aspartate carbamoyltransferase catalytic subunit [Acidimicrobiales bacterium]|nr:aspartate carbamoyltransferase catalytic subunit [Acidimicrobiales bacterium]|tara:strand:+ start:326 stop:1288 length:963 start_codon:yes stop_codon:yes gene_type:complete
MNSTPSRSLLSIEGMTKSDIEEILDLTDTFDEIGRRPIPKVPALRGRTVATVFFENSTRTRLSFETAARRLSADTMSFGAGSSSLSKGESIRDTVEVIEAYGADVLVVRHPAAGIAQRIDNWTDALVVNAGDGCHEHPTQALLDAYTLRKHKGSLNGLRIAIVGDIRHSRVARSDVLAFTMLGAEVVLVAPPTLLPPSLEGWPVTISYDLDEVLPTLDVCYLLRMQNERISEGLIPSVREYTADYGLNIKRAATLPKDALICHPGPTNRGIEIEAAVASDPRSVILDQVSNGVSIRMAVLFLLLGSGRNLGATSELEGGQ